MLDVSAAGVAVAGIGALISGVLFSSASDADARVFVRVGAQQDDIGCFGCSGFKTCSPS
jgi:hypothetical protein